MIKFTKTYIRLGRFALGYQIGYSAKDESPIGLKLWFDWGNDVSRIWSTRPPSKW